MKSVRGSVQSESIETVARIVARHFPDWSSPTFERVSDGGSTRVYRIRTGGSVLYLRVFPEAGSSFVPEARVHQILREKGARVPDVLLVEAENSELRRSIMVTTEIVGLPVHAGEVASNIPRILGEAGKDLASINRVPVEGFGWIRRDLGAEDTLRGEFPTYSEWVDDHYGRCLGVLAETGVLTRLEVASVQDLIATQAGSASSEKAYLAHGDFDPTHIYVDRGTYSGIIDFGEIRGTPSLYDLGHFQIKDRDLLPHLLEGYAFQDDLPSGYRRKIDFFSLIIALRRLSRHVQTGRQLLATDLAAISWARLALG
ncbi:MAG TPA: aminoglycoside phosphotransferase family protein [Chloroflexota bacterium]|nr:aminoglycoside phosphotransferase family protein [Chloroflexota bacterium]